MTAVALAPNRRAGTGLLQEVAVSLEAVGKAYGGGSERIVGAAIGKNRRRWILATKVANVMAGKPHDGGLSRRWMLQACDEPEPDGISDIRHHYGNRVGCLHGRKR